MEILKTVLKTDLEYWKDIELKSFLSTRTDDVTKIAQTTAAISINLIEYYLDIIDSIEKGENDLQRSGDTAAE